MQIGAAIRENSMEGHQKLRDRTTVESSNSTSEYLSKGKESKIQKDIMVQGSACDPRDPVSGQF